MCAKYRCPYWDIESKLHPLRPFEKYSYMECWIDGSIGTAYRWGQNFFWLLPLERATTVKDEEIIVSSHPAANTLTTCMRCSIFSNLYNMIWNILWRRLSARSCVTRSGAWNNYAWRMSSQENHVDLNSLICFDFGWELSTKTFPRLFQSQKVCWGIMTTRNTTFGSS